MKGILVVGHGEAGKDTFAGFLSSFSNCLTYDPNTGSTSRAIAHHLALRKGTSPEYEFSVRRDFREEWYQVGNELLMAGGDDALVRWCEKKGNNVVTGVRTVKELMACKDRYLVVEVVRPGVWNVNGSFRGTNGLVDVVIYNDMGMEELKYLARAFFNVYLWSSCGFLPFPVSELRVNEPIPTSRYSCK